MNPEIKKELISEMSQLHVTSKSSISAALTTMAQADQFVYNQNISATNVTIYVTQNTITTADGTSRYYFYSQAHQNKTWTTEHLPARKSKLSINGLIRQVPDAFGNFVDAGPSNIEFVFEDAAQYAYLCHLLYSNGYTIINARNCSPSRRFIPGNTESPLFLRYE